MCEHLHEHEHHHEHSHEHEHLQEASSPAETLALLNYMLGHNRHHAQELHELAHGVENAEARSLLHEAVEALDRSNDKLDAALKLLKGE